MASTDNEALLERVTTEGFEIDFDPPGDGMCFYAATGHQLGMSANAVHKLIFNYLRQHRYEDNGDDRLSFLCSVDLGKKVPESWEKALDLLKQNYANAMVIRSVPEILHHKVIIVTVHGSSPSEYVKEFEPKKGPYIGTLYYGHTGNHYVALKPFRNRQSDDNQMTCTPTSTLDDQASVSGSPKTPPESLDQDSDCLISPQKVGSEKKKQSDDNHVSLASTRTLDHDSSEEDLAFGTDEDSDVIIISPPKGNIKKEKSDKNHGARKAPQTRVAQDSDCEIISPKKAGSKNKKAKRKTASVMDWWDDEEDYQPGIAVFKGIKLDPFDPTQDHVPPATKTTPSPNTTANPKIEECIDLKRALSYNSSDEEPNVPVMKKQRKIGPDFWENVEVEEVDHIPEDIDGSAVYKIKLSEPNANRSCMSVAKDGRSWKKDSETEWAGFNKVRYSNCSGSYVCTNPKCDFKKEYGVTNNTQFVKKTKLCRVCNSPGKYVPCLARKYVVVKKRSVFVYHCGKHTCPFKPVISKPKEEIKRTVSENPSLTPSQIQSNIIVSKMRQESDWASIEKSAAEVIDRKWISNEKQKIKAKTEPHGHNFEAVAHFKQYADSRDPYYVHKLNDRRGNPDKPSFVFKTSKLKAKFALCMDRTSDHVLSEEFCFFDGKVKRCKGFVSLTASVYHPLLRKLVPLATMECETEDSCSVELFWNNFNEVLRKESKDNDYVFNPRGWVTDMAGSNMEGLRRSIGPHAVERVKTCEFHFKDCRNRQARKLKEEDRRNFKNLCNRLLEAESPASYEKAREDLENFIEEDGDRKYLHRWIEWWHKRRNYIFRAFVPLQNAPKMNQAETIHASWVKRDRMNMSLLDAAHADARDNVQLEVEYKAFLNGTTKGGGGPSLEQRRDEATRSQLRRATSLGEDLVREDLRDKDRAEDLSNPMSSSNPYDLHNAGAEARRSNEGRGGRYRSVRSKLFLQRLERAKQEKETMKIKSSSTQSSLKRTFTVVNPTRLSSEYKVEIGNTPSCECEDFAKHSGKELCKHIVWLMLNICGTPENSYLLHQLFLTDSEVLTVLGNTQTVIPECFLYKNTTPSRSRKEMVQNLLKRDARSQRIQIWTLSKKEKKKGMVPRCRACRNLQNEGELTISVKGLYVPYGQDFATETMFYFCPNVTCINNIPPWTNLNPPQSIVADKSSVTEVTLNKLKEDGLPID